MDTIDRDINQSDDEEKPKKTVLQRLFDLLASWKLKLKGWGGSLNDWAGKYKPTIELAAVIAALLTLVFIYFQVDGLNEQTKAIIEQNKAIRNQNEALWYSHRPRLRIKGITASSDIVPFDSSFENVTYLNSDGQGDFIFYYTVENVGQSYAIIDTLHFSFSSEKHNSFNTVEIQQIVSPQESFVDGILLPMLKSGKNVLGLNYIYNWEKGKNNLVKFKFEKFYQFTFENQIWRSRILSKVEFDSIVVSKSR